MYNIQTILDDLEALVGFENESGYNLSQQLTSSLSGLKINQQHPLTALSVLESSKPENMSLDDFLGMVRRNATTKAISDVINLKLTNKVTKEVLGLTSIFDSTASLRNLQSREAGRFVGWLIRPNKFEYLNHEIKSIGVQFLENDTFPIHIFHSSQKTPVRTITINYTKPTSVEWVDLEEPIILNYTDYDEGGYFLIGYYEDDLSQSNRAIYKRHNLSKRPCGSCSPRAAIDQQLYNRWSNYFKIATVTTNDPLEVRDLNFINDTNFGLNFKIKSYCDITNFIVENKNMFVYPILYRTMIDLIRYIEMSPTRNNRVTEDVRKEAYVAINGAITENNFIRNKGLMHEYDEYVRGLDFNLSRLEPVCIPCDRRGVRWNKSTADVY
jgi:hypothetical protein